MGSDTGDDSAAFTLNVVRKQPSDSELILLRNKSFVVHCTQRGEKARCKSLTVKKGSRQDLLAQMGTQPRQ